jgi:ATP-binding cassette subfamily B protein
VTSQRRSDEDDPGDDAATSALPELEDGDWMHHATEFAHTSFWAVARRLPRLVREAVALAWATSRWDTAVSLGLNVAAG